MKHLAVTAAAMSLDPFRGISTAGDAYQNARLGLRLAKPPGWEFSSIADFAALRERQVLEQLLGNEIHPLKDPSNLPVFIFECPAHRRGYFAPGITLYDEPLRGPAPADQVEAHARMLSSFRYAYKDLEVHGAPKCVAVSDASATEATWSYLHQIEDGPAYALRVKSLLVFREPRVHTFYFVDSHATPCISEDVWGKAIQSISYNARSD